ncbi:acyltransferase family protein [Kineococcus arenarius]|uniref:acyltransferase family protein n=1 Tax=unclassified Kineococcus TaxID=2621656 RepID=UPI003D7EDF42
MGDSPVRPPRLPSLTGLRYLAAAVVVLHHVLPVLAPGSVLARYSSVGYTGVTFFFVLSGFVLTWSAGPGVPLKVFYRRRFARVYPMHLLTTLAAAGVNVLTHADKSLVAVGAALFLLHAWVPQESFYFGAANGPSWSLSVEAFFYLLFPFVVGPVTAVVRATRWWVLPVGTVLLELAFGFSPVYDHWFAYICPAYRVGEFATGIALAVAVRQGLRTRVPLALAVGGLTATFLALAAAQPGSRHGVVDALVLPAIVLVLVAAASTDLRGRRTLWSLPVVVLLGEWSYALYLTHYSTVRLIARLIGTPDLHPVAAGALSLAFLLVATAVAGAAFVLVERPAERRLRGPRRGGTSAGPAPERPAAGTPGPPGAQPPGTAGSTAAAVPDRSRT